jgi:hypothetical protein
VNVRHGLIKARELIDQHGWAGPDLEPMCGAAGNIGVFETSPHVQTYSVMGALLKFDVYPEGWRALEAVVCPAQHALDRYVEALDAATATVEQLNQFQKLCRAAVGELYLQCWLEDPQRTRGEVLRALLRAIERSQKMGERR